ncbi:diguanylate cyclase [Paenibacillus sp. M1]|uniref:Diguanylate cyclase n=1 Tax=Paenibacillus haidiansis TaxID=1574488 RepID=A0ABU7VXH1_9BACL
MGGFLSEQSVDIYKSILNYNSDAIFILSTEGRIMDANQGLTKILGYLKEEILGLPYANLILPDQIEKVNQYFTKVLQGISYDYIAEAIAKSGEQVSLHVKNVPLLGDGEVVGVFGIAVDVTEQQQLERALKESEERYRLLAENSLDLIQLVNLDGIVTFASPSHKMVLGYGPEEYIGKWVFHRPDEGVDTEFQLIFFDMVVSQRPFTYEIARRHKEGHSVWVELKGTPMFDEEGHFNNMMLVGREVTERKNYQNRLEQLSYHDTLTGAPNRRLFSVNIERILREDDSSLQKLAVMFLDLDKFKQINDSLGHDAGDELLQQFVKRVKECLRESDILARIGGDEFVVALPELDEAGQAVTIAQEILHSLRRPWILSDHEVVTTSSIGIAYYEQGDREKELIQKADTALYQAKSAGKNTYRVYNST